jgi:hypothetical protein
VNANTTAGNIVTLFWPLWIASLSWLSVKAVQFVSLKTNHERQRAAQARLESAVRSAVREVQQVFVDGLKAASIDGALTPDQRSQAKRAALDSVRAQLGPRGRAEVRHAFGLEHEALEPLLARQVEAAVHRLKAEGRSPAGAGTAGDAVPFAG